MKRSEFHSVLDWRISRQDSDREILTDILDPTALANRTQPERDGFVERFGSYLGGVLDAFGVPDGDAAGTNRHRRRVAYSLSIR
jgi:hypothetical protein